jgi:hypothetical protein
MSLFRSERTLATRYWIKYITDHNIKPSYVTGHVCSGLCDKIMYKNMYICVKTGNGHVCGSNCDMAVTFGEYKVCPITNRKFNVYTNPIIIPDINDFQSMSVTQIQPSLYDRQFTNSPLSSLFTDDHEVKDIDMHIKTEDESQEQYSRKRKGYDNQENNNTIQDQSKRTKRVIISKDHVEANASEVRKIIYKLLQSPIRIHLQKQYRKKAKKAKNNIKNFRQRQSQTQSSAGHRDAAIFPRMLQNNELTEQVYNTISQLCIEMWNKIIKLDKYKRNDNDKLYTFKYHCIVMIYLMQKSFEQNTTVIMPKIDILTDCLPLKSDMSVFDIKQTKFNMTKSLFRSFMQLIYC